MGMQWIERELQATGAPEDQTRAGQIAAILLERGGDVPLPNAATSISLELYSKLERAGLRSIYGLTGQSIGDLRRAGKPLFSTWHQDYPDFEALPARTGWVFIDAQHLFLPDSFGKSLDEQEDMLSNYSHELQQALGTSELEAINGEAPDWAELAFAHLEATGQQLFGPENENAYTRTKTKVDKDIVTVGHSGPDGLLDIDSWSSDGRADDVGIAPLIVLRTT